MKSVCAIFAIVLFLAGQAFGADKVALKSQKDKLSYAIGVSSGKNLKKQSVDIDPDIMMQGLKDGLSGGKTLLTDQEMGKLMTAFQMEMAAKQTKKQEEIRKALADKNKKAEKIFFAENKKKEGVKTLPSGLQYKVLKEGKGKSPKAADTVIAHYRGSMIGGTEFVNTYKSKEPAGFKLDSVSVIKGWAEALPLMKEGAKWQLFIPSALAYGENGSGTIEPNAALIFEVELISVSEEIAASSPTPETEPSTRGEKSSTPAAGK
jgi:FKBP-type peptidyl-prolyl cis-trans isomerase